MYEGRFLQLGFWIILNNEYNIEVRTVIKLYYNEKLITLHALK